MEGLLFSKNIPLGDAKVKRTMLLISAICGLAVILVSSNIIYANATIASNETTNNAVNEELTDSTNSENQPDTTAQQTTQLSKQPGISKPDSGTVLDPTNPDTNTNFECDTSGPNQQCYCRGNADCFDMGRAGVCSGTLVPHPGGGSGTYKCTRSQN